MEQFRRFANMYFLLVGVIMAVGHYSTLYESAISPWTTLGPLAFVVSVSLLAEGSADAKRHRSDKETNIAPCVILRRGDEINADEEAERETTIIDGKDIVVSLSKSYFQTSNSNSPATPNASKLGNDIVKVGFQKIPVPPRETAKRMERFDYSSPFGPATSHAGGESHNSEFASSNGLFTYLLHLRG